MKALSIRWKLVLPTMSLAALAALLLVLFQHSRNKEQLVRQLERTLATKCEEVHSVLRSGATSAELGSFFEVETRYLNSPYEYFYEVVADGDVLLSSLNLDGQQLLASSPAEALGTHPHPHRTGEFLRVRSESLAGEFPGGQAARLSVGVSLAPLEAAVRSDLVRSLEAAAAGLAVLCATLWLVVTHTLRRVAAITRRTATITATNLRERLPVQGSGDELDELARVLNEMLAGLARALEQMEAFTSDAAHQLRTPLTRVRGELDLILRDGGPSGAVRLRLEEVREELEHLARTCSRLLLLARLDRGALDASLLSEDVDLRGTVEDLVEQVQRLAAERGVEVRCTVCEDVHVRCSRQLVVEALLNLLDNAQRVSSSGKVVEVSLRRSESEALITVSDQGPGIPPELREQVFRRFFRHAADPADGGTGLGLAIVRGIARAHGGDVRAESSPAGGASFVLTLPLSRKPLTGFSAPSQPILNPAG